MLVRFGPRILVPAAIALLVAGCHSPPPDSRQPGAVTEAVPSAGEREDPGAQRDVVEAHAHYSQAVIHELDNEPDAALKEYVLAARDDLANEALTLEVSRRLLQAKQPEQALDLLVRSSGRAAASGDIYAQLGQVYSRLGRTSAAIEASRIAIKKQPQSLEGYRNLFVTYLQNQKSQEALNVLEEAARTTQTSPEFLIGVAELYASFSLQFPAQKAVARAKGAAVLQRAGKNKINDPQLRLRQADAYNLLGQDQAAAEIYLDLLKRLPDLPFVKENVRVKLAEIYLRTGDHNGAREQFESIIRDNPTDAQAYYYLGSIAYSDTNYVQAAEWFSRVLLLDPDYEQAYYDLAASQLYQDKASESLATLAKARQKFQQSFMLEYLSAIACSHQKDFTNAVGHFSSAEVIGRATGPKRLTESFYFQYGAACERAGDYEQAERAFEQCLKLAPDNAEAQNYLGYMWADHGEKLDRARELIEKALKAEPQNAAYLDSMGWVLYKLRQPEAALGFLLDAIRLSEEKDATLLDHLGDIYAALKQPEKARDAWRQSLAVEPNEAIQKKLAASPE